MQNQKSTFPMSTGNFFGEPSTEKYSTQINNPLNNQSSNFIQNQNYYSQNQNYYSQNPNYYSQSHFLPQNIQQQNNNQFYPQQQTFMQKVNSTATGVIDYLKSKTPSMPTINLPSNPLAKIDLSVTLTEINTNEFENETKNNISEVNCATIQKSKLNNIDVVCKIINPRIINDSYIKPSYVLYDIVTEQFNWVVSRRYSDFIWLKDTLQAIFPMEILPVLPKKKLTNKRFEKEFIEKRTKGLQNFLNNILKNENLKSCESLSVFLSCSERNFFEQEMRVLNTNILTAQNINHIRSMDGKIKLMNFESIQNSIGYFNNINNYFKCQNETIQTIQSNLHNFNYNLTLACINLDEVEKGFNKLNSLSEKVKLSESISNVLIQYETFFKNWKRILMNETIVFKDVVKSFFKNIKGKCENFSNLITKQETMREDFINKITKLNLKKETLWQKMDMKNFEINPLENIDTALLFRDKKYAFEKMCYKETEELNKTRGFIQYYYYQNYMNFKNLLNEFEKSYNDNLKEFSTSIQPTVTDGVEVWSFLSSNIPLDE